MEIYLRQVRNRFSFTAFAFLRGIFRFWLQGNALGLRGEWCKRLELFQRSRRRFDLLPSLVFCVRLLAIEVERF